MPRMRRGLRALAAGGLGLAVSLVAACGSNSGLLSSSDASTLQNLIQQVSADVNSGNCAAVPGDLGFPYAGPGQSLPSSVSSKLRASLNEGVGKVTALAQRNCPATATAQSTTSTPSTTRTTTSASPDDLHQTPTHTATAPPTTTATTPTNPGTTSTGPGSGGTGLGNAGGNGGGGGNGNGNGNGH